MEGLSSSVNTVHGSCIEKIVDKQVGRVKLKEELEDVSISVHIMLLTFIVVRRLLAKVNSAQDKQGNRHVSTTEEN